MKQRLAETSAHCPLWHRELAGRSCVSAKKEGLPVLITETYRSQVRQDYLYAQAEPEWGRLSHGHEIAAIQADGMGLKKKPHL